MIKNFFIISILALLVNAPLQANASEIEIAEKPCQSKYLLKTETDECQDRGLEHIISPTWKNDVTNEQMAQFMCQALAEGDWLDANEQDNSRNRVFLYKCMKLGYLAELKAQAELLDKDNVSPNSMGIHLEKYNIWFYTQNPEGKQSAGLNIYAPEGKPASWVIVGFHSTSCHDIKDYDGFMRFNLKEPMQSDKHVVLTWEMPEGAKLTDGGCLDILAAG